MVSWGSTNQVEIDMVCLQSLKLRIQIMVHTYMRFDESAMKLCRQFHLLAIFASQSSTEERSALSIVIWVGDVNVIHAVINGMPSISIACLSSMPPLLQQAIACIRNQGWNDRRQPYLFFREHDFILMFP